MSTMPLISEAARDCIISIEVGPDKVKYSVYKSVLMHYSKYFHNSLGGSWKEAANNMIQITDIDPSIFNIFVNWLYRQALPVSLEDWVITAELTKLSSNLLPTQLCNMLKMKTYVFADRFQVPALRKALQREIASPNIDCAPSFDMIIYAFENLREGDPILLFLVDSTCMFWNPFQSSNEEKAMLSRLPHDYLAMAFTRYGRLVMTQWGNAPRKLGDVCQYHEHESVDEKQACERAQQGSQTALVLTNTGWHVCS
ncbi:hypothetical protein K491DRAFT_673381 [Lophiostoma macrostomum CBS 122681]|uniref:BTB domain-containing protein n=1 Tax=Lophiostoma macrostomum CBS 122681 TaxID=1314788 RepID=A0A6A6TT22_9PLEO|nr:hypothetical protein K491DRAFT_673381 [Lophiostoma macrostomum CBS 122681]